MKEKRQINMRTIQFKMERQGLVTEKGLKKSGDWKYGSI